MDMQAADRQPPHDTLQVVAQVGVAAPLGGLLRVPAGKGMGRRGDRREAMARGDRDDSAAQPAEIRARLGEAGADPRADLDLRAQKLRADLPRQQRLAFGQHLGRRVAGDIARPAVDEEIFLLDAEGEFGFGHRHANARSEVLTPSQVSRPGPLPPSRPGRLRPARRCARWLS